MPLMIKNYSPTPEVPENVLRENDFRLMFINCPSVTFETVIERQEPQVISEPKKFDEFDWDKDFSEAYKE